ncbi:MAG: hypothetical protein LBF83_03480 [Spirochaetaceae bacterium]|jgi:hypothetical protein|nr:hypothetical protein [Spirochaetaceae bacterium]
MSYDGNEKLRRFLYKKIYEYAKEPAGPERLRLLTLGDMQRELDENGIQIPGFSMSKRIREWSQGSSDSTYTITCDELNSECFFCLEFYKNRFAIDRVSFYMRFYDIKSQQRFIDESEISFVYRLIENFKDIAEEYIKLRGEIERGEKLRQLTSNSIETWLALICKNISLPYHIVKMKSRMVFYLLLENGRQLEIYIPYNNFQPVMASLENTINKYLALQNDCAAKVLISNRSNSIRWKNAG